MSYACRRCGERHRGLPMSYGTDAPDYWDPSLAGDKSSTLGQEQCVIKDEHFFVRGRLVIPVTDAAGSEFDWGVWVSLSRESFTRALSLWTTPGREREQPYFGWMSTELPLYEPSTLSLGTRVHTQAVGQRPLVELEPTDHPLAVEQRTGITLARVQEIAETLMHALPASHPCTRSLSSTPRQRTCRSGVLSPRRSLRGPHASPHGESRYDAPIPAVLLGNSPSDRLPAGGRQGACFSRRDAGAGRRLAARVARHPNVYCPAARTSAATRIGSRSPTTGPGASGRWGPGSPPWVVPDGAIADRAGQYRPHTLSGSQFEKP